MNVTIKERKLSFTSEFDITAPGATYYARKAIFSFNDHIELQDNSRHVVATIQGSFSPLHEKHDFHFADGREFHFECRELWRRAFVCIGPKSFNLYEHKGLRYSIFSDDGQIAAIEKNRVVWAHGNEYEIRMNSDADLIVVLCMILTINSAEVDNKDSSVTIDLGHIGPEVQPFDESWQPR